MCRKWRFFLGVIELQFLKKYGLGDRKALIAVNNRGESEVRVVGGRLDFDQGLRGEGCATSLDRFDLGRGDEEDQLGVRGWVSIEDDKEMRLRG